MGEDTPMDFEMALEEFGDDREFLMTLLGGFLDIVEAQLGKIQDGLAQGDSELIRGEAHAIKGGALNLTANELAKVAANLEDIGKSGELTKGAETFERLEREFHRLKKYAESC